MRFPVRLALIALALTGALPCFAQSVVLGARDTVAIEADPATTITKALRITNSSAAPLALAPAIALPLEWSAPIGAMPFSLGAGQTDSWLVGIRIPARAPAGRYVIGISAADTNGSVLLRDSLVVTVRARRGLDVALTNRPTYAISGEPYHTTFLLQNRGNVPATFVVAAVSGMGGKVDMGAKRIALDAGESRSFDVGVTSLIKGAEARDEVLELSVSDAADSTVTAGASARVTIVQRANSAEPLHRVSSQLRVRAADAAAGVSPYELVGAGALRDGGNEQLSYLFRGSPGKSSQFGDQDEYRVELTNTHYTARVGDAFYRSSQLTNSGQAGFGAGLELRDGALTAGAFSQRFRFQQGSPKEHGAYVSARRDDLFGAPLFTLSGVSRSGSQYDGKVLSTSAAFEPMPRAIVELELAGSNGPQGSGSAHTARVSGGDAIRYDFGHTFGTAQFSGTARGAQHDYGSVAVRGDNEMQYSISGGMHHTNGVTLGISAPQDYRTFTMTVDHATRYTLQLNSATRANVLGAASYDESQRGVLGRTDQTFGDLRVWGGVGAGIAKSGLEGRQFYHELSAGASTTVGSNSYSLYGETSNGMIVTRGASHLLTMGGDARLQITPTFYTTLAGFSTSVLTSGERYSQLDAGFSQYLRTGSTLSLRVRLTGASGAGSRQIAFLEYSTPLQMPIGRTRSIGRVRGRVVDQETGHGVAGTLVRLGPQAAITDADGRVAFAGLPAGEYRLTIAQQRSQAATVFTGDPTVVVDSTRHSPTTFNLAVQRAGVIAGSVRQMAVVRTGIGGAADSIADAGAMREITLALIGARDTVYAETDADGAFRFGEVSGGVWTLKVLTEASAGMRWEPGEIGVSVAPGASRTIEFRQLPRRKAVQMMSGEVITAPPRQQQRQQQ